MEKHEWIESIGISIMATNVRGEIIDMNAFAAETFQSDGGRELLGKNLADCHSLRSNEIIERLMREGAANIYTIQKKGKKKLICQVPWFKQDGGVGGLVELSIPLPEEMPHFNRD